MKTNTTEIAPGIYRFSTCVPDAAPGGFTFSQFLVLAEQPLLFHTGPRKMFPLVSQAISAVMPLAKLRFVTFGHVESDECGAMNELLAAAPDAVVAHGVVGCMVSLNDLCDRPPRPLADGEVIDLGGKRVRHVDTPQVPHNWESRVLFEETTRTLFCGDLFTQAGDGPALTGDAGFVDAAIQAEDLFAGSAISPVTGRTIRKLAALEPKALATMHGPTFEGDCVAALHRLADDYDARVARLLQG